jgi:hypothetical protein
VANQSGTAIVTVMVTDGGPDGNFGTPGEKGAFSRMFTVTVDAVNDPPTLDVIADPVAINEDTGQQTVNLAGITAGERRDPAAAGDGDEQQHESPPEPDGHVYDPEHDRSRWPTRRWQMPSAPRS